MNDDGQPEGRNRRDVLVHYPGLADAVALGRRPSPEPWRSHPIPRAWFGRYNSSNPFALWTFPTRPQMA